KHFCRGSGLSRVRANMSMLTEVLGKIQLFAQAAE
ncbi:MAG: hypothetical protein CFH37_01278, partial [Alphaproteobacteria bacterium MarineAlpha9_Bin7]